MIWSVNLGVRATKGFYVSVPNTPVDFHDVVEAGNRLQPRFISYTGDAELERIVAAKRYVRDTITLY